MELARYLEQIYPDLIGNVSGGNYPPPTWAAVLAQVAGMFQMGGIMLAFFGGSIFRMVGMATPAWYTTLENNKLMVVGGLFLFNSVAQNMCATGAFEITMNGKPVFSKLSSGRMPSVNEVRSNLERYGIKPLRRGAQFSGTSM